MSETIPETQRAVQLVKADEMQLRENKPVFTPGPHQVLCRVEVVGLCFSDLKLLKQFSGHVRKSEVVSGIEKEILGEMPHYVPGDKPTVPGHETVVRIVNVGDQVSRYKRGERYLLQTDYRWLRTSNSCSAFGYNFEGALQEYVLLDERVVTAPDGESMLIPVPEDLSASALALVEPWACVEDSYVEKQRRSLKPGGQMLIVADAEVHADRLQKLFSQYGKPAQITWLSKDPAPSDLGIAVQSAASLKQLKDASYADVLYFGSNPETVQRLFAKVANSGIFNLVLCGEKFDKPVVSAVGRIHYGAIRLIGTRGSNPCDSMASIPGTAEIRPGNKINIIGAAGPMGAMHVIRNLCQGVADVSVHAGDLNDDRLASLERMAQPLAEQNHVTLHTYNPSKDKPGEKFDYIVLMAPVPALVAQAVRDAAPGAIINIFAGIPADVTAELDLDAYVSKQLYFIGTSGSVLEDMKQVLAKVVSRRLDTNLSVAAIGGLEGAIDGIRAVEKNLMPGKIIIYPQCRGLKLTPLTELEKQLPAVGKAMDNGHWTAKAEKALLASFKS